MTTTTTDESAALDAQLAPIRARAAAATPGPWISVDSNDDHTNPMWQVYDNVYIRPGEYDQDTPYMSALIENSETGRADADFIAAARTDIPALLDIIEQQGTRLVLAEKTIAEVRHQLEVTGYWHQKDPLFAIVHRYDAAKPGQ